MSDSAYTINTKGLDQLVKALKVKPPVARIGILSDKPHYAQLKAGEKAPKTIPTNAEVGAVHEFGAPAKGIPQRSFLRVPIADHLEKEMKKADLLDRDTLTDVIKKGSVLPWMKKIAIIAEGIVTEAFETGGFGKWKTWADSHYMNHAGLILVDTTQLRNSITSEVKE